MPIDPKPQKMAESEVEKPADQLTPSAERAVLGLGLMALVSGLLLGLDAVWAMLIAVLSAAAVAIGARGPSKKEAGVTGPSTPEPEQNASLRQRPLEGLVTTGESRLPVHDIGAPEQVTNTLLADASQQPRRSRARQDRAGRGSR